MVMDEETHRQIHVRLHKSFDDLLADYINHTAMGTPVLSRPISDLMTWSHEQTIKPTQGRLVYTEKQEEKP
jgi:hypothetical protein